MAASAEMAGCVYSLGLEETELRLGLPVGDQGEAAGKSGGGKRSFCETVDLKLNLQIAPPPIEQPGRATAGDGRHLEAKAEEIKMLLPSSDGPEKPRPSKAQVVGWPPVRSYRKSILTIQSTKSDGGEDGEKASGNAAFVKVSMDGAPYLRKVDLKMYKSYQDLSHALEKMFSSFTIGNCGSQGMNGRDFMNESRLMDLLNGSEYVPTYEDKDGDWMLIGDVPWEMFVSSCKRIRIMKGSDAIGLAPRAVEKCKNRM